MERCALLSARRYSFREDGGRLVEGVTLVYVTGEREETGDQLGMAPLTVSSGPELFTQLREVPGIYDLDFKQRPGPKGRPTLQVTKLTYVRPLDFSQVLEPAA
jgi:hypothetical protein